MEIEILFFGITEDIAGKRSEKMSIEKPLSVASFKTLLQEKYPALKSQTNFAVALNMEYTTDEKIINNNDTIALIPPVSGG